jgi:hypothetical protein
VSFSWQSTRRWYNISAPGKENFMSSYVNILENIANPISELVMNSMKFYLLRDKNRQRSTIIATMLPNVELMQMIDDFRIYKNWDVEEFIAWLREIKAIKVFKVDLNPVQVEEY